MAIRIKAWLFPSAHGEKSVNYFHWVLIAILAGQEALLDELYQDLDDAVQEKLQRTHSCHWQQLVLPRLACLVNNDEHFIGRQTYYPSRHWIRGQNRRTHLIKTLEECLVCCLIILQLVVVCHCQRGQIIYSLFMNLSSPFQSLKKI